MKSISSFALAVLTIALFAAGPAVAGDAPADRVMALYFHRTERCPSCQQIGGYTQEAIETGFVEEMKRGVVAFRFIDFQDEKNARFTNAYRITEPALVVLKISGGKVISYRNLEEIWDKLDDRAAFFLYVQENVRASLPSSP